MYMTLFSRLRSQAVTMFIDQLYDRWIVIVLSFYCNPLCLELLKRNFKYYKDEKYTESQNIDLKYNTLLPRLEIIERINTVECINH